MRQSQTGMDDPLGLIGTTIAEKYAIESVVGLGGFAVVYRAQHLMWKRPVAVKVFRAMGDLDPARRDVLFDDFVQEGALLAELSEKTTAICQARDIGTLTTPAGQNVPYTVLEWLEGRTLEAVLHDERNMRPRSLAETVRLLDPIAEALELAHARGITHRDVKPSNIFVLGHPRAVSPSVKLLDFGIAKVAQDVEKLGLAVSTGTGSFTPFYAAPEQFNRTNGTTGPWTDVFQLALVAVEVLSGQQAMNGESVVELAVVASDAKKRPTPRTLGVKLSDHVERLFGKALAVAPAERFATAGAFWRELRREALGESQSSLPAAAPVAATPNVAPAAVPDLDFGPRPSRSMAAVSAGRPSGSMAAVSNPAASTAVAAARPSGSMAAVQVRRPSGTMEAPSLGAAPSSSRMSAAPVRSAGVVDTSLDDFDMEIERGDLRSMPNMASHAPASGMHVSHLPARSAVPIASTGLGLAAEPSNRGTAHDDAGTVSGGLRVVSWLVATIVSGGTAAGLVLGAHLTRPVRATSFLPRAFDGTSATYSGGVAVTALLLSIAFGFIGVKGRPRSWALVIAAGGLLLIALAMVTVALGSTGEVTAPPDGVLLMPYLSPAVVLGLAVSALGRAAWLFMHRSTARKALALPVGAIAGALGWCAWAMAMAAR